MPVNFFGSVLSEGTKVIPHYEKTKIVASAIAAVAGIKYYTSGTTNTWERGLHGKVIMMTVSLTLFFIVIIVMIYLL